MLRAERPRQRLILIRRSLDISTAVESNPQVDHGRQDVGFDDSQPENEPAASHEAAQYRAGGVRRIESAGDPAGLSAAGRGELGQHRQGPTHQKRRRAQAASIAATTRATMAAAGASPIKGPAITSNRPSQSKSAGTASV